MKKRIFYVLSTLFIFTAPSMVQAEEKGGTVDSIPNSNSYSSHQSLLGLHKLTNIIDGLGSLLVKDSDSESSSTNEQANQVEVTSENLDAAAQVVETAVVETSQAVTQEVKSGNVIRETEAQAAPTYTVSNSVIPNTPTNVTSVDEGPSTDVPRPKPLLSIGLLGLNINLLGGQSSNSSMPTSLLSIDASEPGSNLLNLNLGLGSLGNVGLDLFSGPSVQAGNGESSVQAGLLGLAVTDSALLGNLNVGLLSNTKNLTEDGFASSASLVNLGINNSLLTTNVGVLESSKTVSGDTTTYAGSIVSAGVSAPLIGDIHTGIGEVSGLISPERTEIHTGLIVADVNNDILGNQHIGVGEYNEVVTDEGKTSSGGLVIVDVEDSPVGDVHVGVGEFENPGDKYIPPVVIGPSLPGTGTPTPSEKGSDPGKTVPGKEIGGNESQSQQDATQTDLADNTVSTDSQSLDLLDVINSPVGEFLQALQDDGNHSVLYQDVDETAQLGLEIEKLNKKTADSTGITVAVSAPSASSSSTSSSTAGLSGGSGTFADLIFGYNLEVSKNNETQGVLKTLSTQWTESPPVQPPIAPFFLAI
ncbi:hypothetical protein [Bacillus marasmi]|uniref:hypothetical protein n=1 Tax=Bacillus marasmi TaxID=1926279 RepID=UPI0011C748E6|nr:hypothetical protein [Bacillus marasmi]